MDQINFEAWLHKKERLTGKVSEQDATQINAVLGTSGRGSLNCGDPLPPLWHWFAFPPSHLGQDLHNDGNTHISALIPPMGENRRTRVEGHVEFIRPLEIGATLERKTQVANLSDIETPTGPGLRISLDHQIRDSKGLAVLERQDIEYLEIPTRYEPSKTRSAPRSVDIDEAFELTRALLFRYSAITFNAHRIHYDLPYAQEIENYPDIVVQPPLQANLLMDLALRHGGRTPNFFSYRNIHPLFAAESLHLQAIMKTQQEWALCTVAQHNHQCMQAEVIWED